jgi:hypothetical protein
VPIFVTALLLVACQATASPTPNTSTKPSIALPTATPRPTPIPTAEPPAIGDVISGFLAIVKDSRLTMHVVVTGEVTVSSGNQSQPLSIDMSMDVKGNDGVGDASVDVGTGMVSFKLLIRDGRGYLDNHGDWTEQPNFEQSAPLNPFTNLRRARDVEYLGPLERDGQRLHRLRAVVWFGGDLADLESSGWTGVRITRNKTVMQVDDAGTPVSLDFVGRLSGRFNGQKTSIDFDMGYDFSDVGEPVTIPRPN